jgi:dTDP-4-dehydrorhamnose 3,5-epimerase
MFGPKLVSVPTKDAVITDQPVNRLPDGVQIHRLAPHNDLRGSVTELYRENWDLGCRPVQLNAISSAAGVLRGVHVHIRHADHLVLLAGRMVLGLHDMRPSSSTFRASCQRELCGEEPRAVVIPVGVAHGFYFPVPSILVYGLSREWDPSEEIGCRWNCQELGLAWPTSAPVLSERDAAAPGYADAAATFERAWAAQCETSAAAAGR